jgi:hypothetical protein
MPWWSIRDPGVRAEQLAIPLPHVRPVAEHLDAARERFRHFMLAQ